MYPVSTTMPQSGNTILTMLSYAQTYQTTPTLSLQEYNSTKTTKLHANMSYENNMRTHLKFLQSKLNNQVVVTLRFHEALHHNHVTM